MLDLESIPHVEELIIANCDAQTLLRCRSVSRRWKELAERVLINRYKDNAFLAVENNEVGVIKLLLEHPECDDINWNITRYYDIAEITPLMLACRNGFTKVVELFLDHSVTKNINLNMRHILGDPTKEGISAMEGDNGEYFKQHFKPNDEFPMVPGQLQAKYRRYTGFTYACHFGHKNVVELMLALAITKGIDVKLRSMGVYEGMNYEDTSFMVACRRGNTEVVNLLLQHSEKIELKAKDPLKIIAFRMACEDGHIDIVQLLLNHSAQHNINLNDLKNGCGMTALMCACKFGLREVVELILDHFGRSIDFNTKTNDGKTALMYACKKGHLSVVQLLLEHSTKEIEMNTKANDGMTALTYACANGHIDVVKLIHDLLPFTLKNRPKEVQDVFLKACKNGHTDIVQWLYGIYAQHIKVNTKADNGMTALMYACQNGHRGVVQLLLENSPQDIELNAVDHNGNTAFWLACRQSHTEVVKLMFDKIMLGLDITLPADHLFLPTSIRDKFSSEIRDLHRQYQKWMQAKNGWTPFMTACRFGRKDSVNFILVNRRKIDLNARDNSGRTGFMLAYSYGHKDVVELLRGYSTSMNIDISID